MPVGLFIKRRSLWVSCVFATTLFLLWTYWPAQTPISPPLPSPNGYILFVKAGRLAAAVEGDPGKMASEQLEATLNANRETLELARKGLTQECRVPTETSVTYIQAHLTELSSIKRLAQLLSGEARLAEVNAKYELAAKTHAEIVRFGALSARGGLIIDKLVGIAVENIGTEELERIIGRLGHSSCRDAIRSIQEVEDTDDSAERYLERDWQWSKETYNFSALRMWLQSAIVNKSISPYRDSNRRFVGKLAESKRRRRKLILRLAARIYELEHGQPPAHAENLVPSILHSVPTDPETGTNLMIGSSLNR